MKKLFLFLCVSVLVFASCSYSPMTCEEAIKKCQDLSESIYSDNGGLKNFKVLSCDSIEATNVDVAEYLMYFRIIPKLSEEIKSRSGNMDYKFLESEAENIAKSLVYAKYSDNNLNELKNRLTEFFEYKIKINGKNKASNLMSDISKYLESTCDDYDSDIKDLLKKPLEHQGQIFRIKASGEVVSNNWSKKCVFEYGYLNTNYGTFSSRDDWHLTK